MGVKDKKRKGRPRKETLGAGIQQTILITIPPLTYTITNMFWVKETHLKLIISICLVIRMRVLIRYLGGIMNPIYDASFMRLTRPAKRKPRWQRIILAKVVLIPPPSSSNEDIFAGRRPRKKKRMAKSK